MSDPRLTDERLKSHLNARQPDRERMCAALLAIDRRFSSIQPRRPEGGRDGGCDIQCIFDGQKCIGAVGFKNNACDSDQQVREIIKKFKDDLSSALKAEPELKHFVFFTNIDLSPSQQEELEDNARSRNVHRVELYWRERIRLILDGVEGFAIRLQYLGIPLSDAEQKVFFSRFGEELQKMISGRLDSIVERMEEIQFRNWKRGRCRSIDVRVRLRTRYSVSGSNHEPFRFALRLHRVLMYGKGEILIGCYSRINQLEQRADYEVIRFCYSDTGMLPQERDQCRIFPSGARFVGQDFESIHFGVAFGSENQMVTTECGLDITELGQYAIDLYCDSVWAPKVDRVEVWYDDYLVQEFINDGERMRLFPDSERIPHWPEEANELAHRTAQYWDGRSLWPDHLCKRKRVGDHDF